MKCYKKIFLFITLIVNIQASDNSTFINNTENRTIKIQPFFTYYTEQQIKTGVPATSILPNQTISYTYPISERPSSNDRYLISVGKTETTPEGITTVYKEIGNIKKNPDNSFRFNALGTQPAITGDVKNVKLVLKSNQNGSTLVAE